MKSIFPKILPAAILLLTQFFKLHAQEVYTDKHENETRIHDVTTLNRLLAFATVKGDTLQATDLEVLKKHFPNVIVSKQERYSTGKNQYKYRSVVYVNMDKLVPLLIVVIKQQEERIIDLELAVKSKHVL